MESQRPHEPTNRRPNTSTDDHPGENGDATERSNDNAIEPRDAGRTAESVGMDTTANPRTDATTAETPGAARISGAVRRVVGGLRRRWSELSRRGRLVSIVGVALAITGVTATLIVTSTSDASGLDAKQTVASYLDAIRAGDVDRALELAGFGSRHDAVFLTDEAISDDWDVTDVSVTADDGAVATVAVTIGVGDTTASGEFELRRSDTGPWRMREPFVEVAFAHSALAYVEVNGVRAPYTEMTRAERFLLFPGAYLFNADTALVTTRHTPIPLLPNAFNAIKPHPGFINASGLITTKPSLTDDGDAAVREAVDAFIDECGKTTDEQTDRGCPFGADSLGTLARHRRMNDFRDMTWTVTTAPQIAITPGPYGFAITTVEPGVVHVEGIAAEEIFVKGEGFTPTGDRPIEADCVIRPSWLDARVTEENEITIALALDRHVDLGVGVVPWLGIRQCHDKP